MCCVLELNTSFYVSPGLSARKLSKPATDWSPIQMENLYIREIGKLCFKSEVPLKYVYKRNETSFV